MKKDIFGGMGVLCGLNGGIQSAFLCIILLIRE